ncbi:MAG: L-threonylcarbamoyladenylate synthase [Propionibacteriaceae bacterium]|nr:L-threonylcarbamoyladenylate synthase [Propionibacteriaceae bacterium]
MIVSLLTQTDQALAAATAAVAQGECIVLPTDTVYGIGADATSASAVQRLLDAKQRGRDMPPPVLLPNTDRLTEIAKAVPDDAYRLAQAFWPGALTLILRAGKPLDLGDRPDTIAVRIPAHDGARALLEATGLLAVSSANLSGCPPATNVQAAVDMLGDTVAVYLDGGRTPGETPSTIVDLSNGPGKVLRQGVISLDALRAICPDIGALRA